MDLEKLQEEVGEWAFDNFGEQPAEFPLLGMGEETGEVSTSILKRAQGIDDSEKYSNRDDVGDEAEQDGIGDIAIYWADALHRTFETDSEELEDESVRALLNFYSAYGELCWAVLHEDVSDRLLAIHYNTCMEKLRAFAEEAGYDFDECVEDAWEEVSGREWDSDWN